MDIKKIPIVFKDFIKEHLSGNKFLRSSVVSVFIKVGNNLFQFLAGILLARTLSVEAFGVYSFVYAMVKMLAIPTELGLPTLLVRYIPNYEASESWAKIKGLIKFTNTSAIVIASILILATYFFAKKELLNLNSLETETLVIGLFLLPVLALGNIRGATLRGFRRIFHGLFPESILRHALFVVGILLISNFANVQFDSRSAIGLNIIAGILSYLLGAYWLILYLPKRVKESKEVYEITVWLRTSLPFLLIGGIQIILAKIDTVFIGFMLDSQSVGIYEIAFRTASLTAFTLGAFNFVLAPYYSKYYNEGDHKNLQKISRIAVIINGGISILILIFLIVFGEEVISFLFGEEYTASYQPMIILIFSQVIGVLFGSVSILLSMTGYERTALKIFGYAALMNIILNYIFIPKYGLFGAAYTSLTCSFLWKVWMYYKCKVIFKIDTSIFGLIKRKSK